MVVKIQAKCHGRISDTGCGDSESRWIELLQAKENLRAVWKFIYTGQRRVPLDKHLSLRLASRWASMILPGSAPALLAGRASRWVGMGSGESALSGLSELSFMTQNSIENYMFWKICVLPKKSRCANSFEYDCNSLTGHFITLALPPLLPKSLSPSTACLSFASIRYIHVNPHPLWIFIAVFTSHMHNVCSANWCIMS